MEQSHNLTWMHLFEMLGTGILWLAVLCVLCFIILMALVWWDAKVNPIVETEDDETGTKENPENDQL